ncbi:YhgE/Pip domain-containing protein [Paenibacillus sp. DMB20]|uniref:YhgE/Pip domain-containing protein n=1 Tax=Paenibacillus sp. DMB20 TaxID=1642570 RepID=UPI0006280AC8|nr:ABC transporter permease [Paenibacillus sp. DMB20]KKO55224.1 ABC transporter [Paenibacillus sp. DMB20]
MNHLLIFLKRPQTIIGIVTALAFQVIFSVVWMTGYQGANDRVKNFRIAVVNEDKVMGEQVVGKLRSSLPFDISETDRESAREELVNREVQMVLTIPADFSSNLQNPTASAKLLYEINESNPQMVKSVMDSAASSVTAALNREASAAGIQAVLEQSTLPPEQAKGAAAGLADRVRSETAYIHPVDGLNNQMVPMMMVIASFVGAMIMGMNMQQASAAVGSRMTKWQSFTARTVINAVSALLVSMLGSTLVLALGGKSAEGFMALWLFQSLFVWVFLVFSQMFLIVFGMAGMLFNITLLSLQLVASGAMVPRQMLGSGFQTAGDLLPATYAVEGLMNILFGGSLLGKDIVGLSAVALISLAVSAAVTAMRKTRHSDGSDEAVQRLETPA